jgi:hypothetical protein
LLSKSKPTYIEIKELDSRIKDKRIVINLSGVASNYEEINDFLSNLKKNESIKDAKIVFFDFPSDEIKKVTFEMRFEME